MLTLRPISGSSTPQGSLLGGLFVRGGGLGEGDVAGHILGSGIEVDLGFGWIPEASMAPPNLDMSADPQLLASETVSIYDLPTNPWLATLLDINLQTLGFIALPQIPRGRNPQPHRT